MPLHMQALMRAQSVRLTSRAGAWRSARGASKQAQELEVAGHLHIMSALEALNVLPYVQMRVNSGYTHRAIVEELRNRFPGVRGISVRSLKRFCSVYDLHATSRISDQVLDVLVAFGIGTVSIVHYTSYHKKL